MKHQLVKIWFYVNWGLEMVNKFKYLGAGILALYVLLKFTDIVWLPVMGIISLPILYIIGWLWVHKMSKALDRMNTDKSTYYGRYTFNLMEEQIRLLRKLNKESENIESLKPDELK